MKAPDHGVILAAHCDNETYRWEPQFGLPDVRMAIVRAPQEETGYLLMVDQPDGTTRMQRARVGVASSDAEVCQHAYAWLAAHDANQSRRGYWGARARCQRAVEIASFYDQIAALNIAFGPSFRAVREIWRGQHEAIGQVVLSDAIHAEVGSYIHHPVFLDACLQLFGATLYGEMSRKTFLPVGMESFYFKPGPVSFAWSYVKLRKAVALEDKAALADFMFYDSHFELVGEIAGFSLRLSDRETLLEHDTQAENRSCYRIGWERLDGARGTELAGQHIVVVGESDPAAGLRQHLPLMQDAPPWQARGAVVMLSAAQDCTVPDSELALDGACRILDAVRALGLERSDCQLTHLWFVTRSAQQVTGHDPIRSEQAMAWGLARSIEREYPRLQVCCIDEGEDRDLATVAQEILSGSTETMVAFRGGARYVARIGRLPLANTDRSVDDTPSILRTTAYGSLDNLYLAPLQRSEPLAHEVEIRVCATGLNFKDVLHALGLLALDGEQSGVAHSDEMLFGGDCAGIVVRTGSAVSSLRAGDRVMACMAFGCFGSHVNVSEQYAARLPDSLPFHLAAAVPTAYLTAYHSLVTCAGLQRGERVLIHAAAGGVGLAATRIALHLGARVYASASRSKQGFLRALGVSGVYDSRNPGFAEELMRDQPDRMDVVLNCLNGEFIERSFEVLKPAGRFVEIGKIGVWSAAEVAARRPDARYALFDLMDVARDEPSRLAAEFKAVLALVEQAQLWPTRVQTFPMARVADAFRCMAEARHIGKIVVTQPEDGAASPIRPDRCHVVVGGGGAIGRALLDWLAAGGARHIVVIGRSEPGEAASRRFDALRSAGIKVRFIRADMSDREQAGAALLQSAAGGVPVGIIFHLAGRLSDALLRNQTEMNFAKVFASKADVAVNLHLASLQTAHDNFVCFSSIAAVFGSPGQTNYAAANGFVDALVQFRRTQGLPGLSVNWGPWAEAGMAESLAASDKARLAETGLVPLQQSHAFALLDSLLYAEQTQAIVVDSDWGRPSAYPAGRIPPCVAALAGSVDAVAGDTENISTALRELPPEARLQALVEASTRCLCQVLRLAPTDIASYHTMGELGLDSLMGMEVRHKLERLIGVPVPVSALLKGPTVLELATELLQLSGHGAAATGTLPISAPAPATSRWLVRVGGPLDAAPRLICFHHLGGSAEFFRQWAEPLLDVAEVFAVQLPGRAQRIDEAPVTDFSALLDQLLAELTPLFDRPFVLFGHSMGSHLAFETARLAQARGYPARHLFASGLWSPLDHAARQHGAHLKEIAQDAIDVPAVLRADAHYMQALHKLVTADAALVTSYPGAPAGSAIGVPLTVFSGDDDRIAPPADVLRWSGCTLSDFSHTVLPGKHMFLIDAAAPMQDQIRAVL